MLPDLEIPLYMLFPNSYSCATYVHADFKIEFHVNLIVIFVLQTIILPLVFLWLLVEGLKRIAGRALGSER